MQGHQYAQGIEGNGESQKTAINVEMLHAVLFFFLSTLHEFSVL